MAHRLILGGDVNLMKVTDAGVPFRHIAAVLHPADAVFANLECCLHLPSRQSHANEGFFADPQIGGEALRLSGIHAVGIANNVNYGAENIAASIATLDRLGILHTGAGADLTAARAPAIIARNGLSVGVAARSIGRPTMRPPLMRLALRCCAATPRIMCRRRVSRLAFHHRTGRACHRLSSPGRIAAILLSSAKTSWRFGRKPTSSLPPAIGVLGETPCNT